MLRKLSREKAFYFFTSLGNYTGETATSLKEFAERIQVVNPKSLEFHLYRRDFEKWIDEVLEDAELAGAVSTVRLREMTGNPLKATLHQIIAERLAKLQAANPL